MNLPTVRVDSRGRINLKAFAKFLDVGQVATVEYIEEPWGGLILKFYDSNGKPLSLWSEQRLVNKEKKKHDRKRKDR